LNVTAVDSDGPGYIQVWGSSGFVSLASNLNKTAGVTIANQVTTQLAPGVGSPNGATITIVNQGSATNLVVDLEGYYVPVA
jgi:copper(I)-binding protein